MPFTEFTCRSGGSNLNAGSLDGSAEAATAPLVSYANGGWNSTTGVFTPASGNPSAAGVAVGQWMSVFQELSVPFSGASGGVPTNWSARWVTTNVTWTEDAGGFLRCTVGTTGRHSLGYDNYTGLSPDVEVLTRVRTNSTPAGGNAYCGLMWRGSGTSGSENGYAAYLETQGAGVTQITLGRFLAGSAAVLLRVAKTWAANTWYWIRVRNVGSSIKVRLWADGSSEPSTWDIDTTDANVSAAGWVGTYCASPAASVDDFDDFSANQLTTAYVARVSAVSSTTITLNLTRAAGTAPTTVASGLTAVVGGAWAGPTGASGFPFGFANSTLLDLSGNFPRVNFKTDQTYSITAAMTHSIVGPTRFQGYTTTFGDGGRAIIDGGTSGASYVLLTLSGANCDILDAEFRNNGASGSSSGFAVTGAETLVRRVVVHDVRGFGLDYSVNPASLFVECEAYNCNQSNAAGRAGFTFAQSCTVIRCVSHDNTTSNSLGFNVSVGPIVFIDCIADGNGAQGFNSSLSTSTVFRGCEAYNNVSDGIRLANGSAALHYIENCNLIKNGGYGINGSGAGTRNGSVINCGFGSGTQANTSGTTTGLSAMLESGSVTYAANVTPWVDPANGDFRITLAAAIGAGRGSFTQTQVGYAGTIAYPDIGAAQHQGAGDYPAASNVRAGVTYGSGIYTGTLPTIIGG